MMEMSTTLRNVDTGVVKDGLLVRIVLLALLRQEDVPDLLHSDVRCDSCISYNSCTHLYGRFESPLLSTVPPFQSADSYARSPL
jgi:hypothetical protein